MGYAVHNVHERVLPVPPEQVWAQLRRLGSTDDPVYPRAWGWVRFPEGIASGAPMIHNTGVATVHCVISEVEPERKLWFEGAPGLDGGHGFLLDPDPRGTRVRHVLEANLPAAMRVLWPLVGRFVHDATQEEILDNLEQLVTGRVVRPYRRPPVARILNRLVVRGTRESSGTT